MSTAVVIGGTRGIGAASAIRLATSFDTVVVAGRSAAGEAVAEAIGEHGGTGVAVRVDVTDAGALRRARDEILDRTGRCDALVNSAGTGSPAAFLGADPAELEHIVATNLMGVVHATHVFAEAMVEQGEGAIVNVGSCLAHRGLNGWAAYSGAKAGVEAFTAAIAVELGPHGVRANTVAPGQVLTGMTADLFGTETAQEAIRRRVPLRRLTTLGDVAELIAFLLSPESRNITGQVVNVDGGYSAAAR